ncbi:MAG: ADOP family duplicated permease [Acidobacteriota bacterium]
MTRSNDGAVVRWLRSLLARALHEEDRAVVLADLDEELDERRLEHGEGAAARWYVGQAFRSVLPALRGRRVWNRVTRKTSQRDRQTLVSWFESALGDFRRSTRDAARRPLSMIVTVVSLGLGIGAVTATYSIVDGLLLSPPVGLRAPEQIASIYTHEPGERRHGTSSYLDFEDLRRYLTGAEELAAVTVRSVALGENPARPLLAEEVSANYFELTGIPAARGRVFSSSDSAPRAPARVAVLGHDLWRDAFGADEGVLGQEILLDGHHYTVIGVAPPSVRSRRAPLEPQIWVPLGSLESPEERAVARGRFDQRGERAFLILARRSEATSFEHLRAEVEAIGEELAKQHAEWRSQDGETRTLVTVSEKASRINPDARGLLTAIASFLLGATGAVLLIACSNVASLLLARTAARRKELALRLSLGASRMRLIAMLVTENLVPTLASSAIGLGVAHGVTHALRSATLPGGFSLPLDVRVDTSVVLVMLGVALASSLAFGLLPALAATRTDQTSLMRPEGAAAGRPRLFQARSLTVVVQCAASLVLVAGATLFLRSLHNSTALDLGFDARGVTLATKSLDAEGFTEEQGLAYLDRLEQRLRARPDVTEVAMSRGIELTLLQLGSEVEVLADPNREAGDVVFHNAVSPGYLEMLSFALQRGRTIEKQDVPGSPRVAVINQAFAERYWPGREPLGQTFQTNSDDVQTLTVVGVTGTGKYLDFDDEPAPYFWTALSQDVPGQVAVLVNGPGAPAARMQVLREEIRLAAGEVQRMAPSTFESHLSLQFAHLRIASTLLGFGGAFGLFLAAIGIYGVVALAITRRSKEMAIRAALGASRGKLFRTVLVFGLRLASLGLVVGLGLAIPGAQALRTVLAGVSPTDPLAFLAATLVLLATALVASALPARRISAVAPMKALREE